MAKTETVQKSMKDFLDAFNEYKTLRYNAQAYYGLSGNSHLPEGNILMGFVSHTNYQLDERGECTGNGLPEIFQEALEFQEETGDSTAVDYVEMTMSALLGHSRGASGMKSGNPKQTAKRPWVKENKRRDYDDNGRISGTSAAGKGLRIFG
jgi:hypothetical protein